MLKKSVLLLFFILSISTFSMVTYADDTSEYVDKSFYAYDEPSFTSAKANHGAAYEPLAITVKEKRDNGWWKVVTWEGEKWINTTGERKDIDKKFYAYNEPSFTSAKANSGGAYEPLTLTVTDGNVQGWLKVVTWEGEKWINTTGERKYIDKKFYAYNEPSFTSAKANSGGAYEPLTLTVTDGNTQGWLKVVTWEGEKWINTAGERKYIDKKFYAYNEPSFTSAKANSGGAYEPLTLTVTDGNTQGWLKVVTWEGEKWINTTGERKYIDKKFYAYNEPSFTSAKANSGGAYEPLTLTVTDGNTQGWLKVVTWEGEKWINLNETDSSSSEYQMPIKNPNVSSWYGSRWGTIHKGIDFAAAKGTPIMASKSGTVEFAGFGVSGQGFGGYGNVVVIKHGDGRWTLYGHMDSISTTVGANVQQGQVIGKVGSTGDSTGNHLHFEVKNQYIGGQVDPKSYLSF